MHQVDSFIHDSLFSRVRGGHDLVEVGGNAPAEEGEDAIEHVLHLVGGEIHLQARREPASPSTAEHRRAQQSTAEHSRAQESTAEHRRAQQSTALITTHQYIGRKRDGCKERR
jgi:hypothetical protein